MEQRIQVKHITRTLEHMERWCREMRMVFSSMDEDQPIGGGTGGRIRPPVLALGCPPRPEEPHDSDCECPKCEKEKKEKKDKRDKKKK